MLESSCLPRLDFSQKKPKRQFGQALMRKNHSLGILFPPTLFLAGTYLLYESTARSEWYMDIYLMAGATISAVGLVSVCWAIQRQFSTRRQQQHVRRHQ
jgi:hypothetical protein